MAKMSNVVKIEGVKAILKNMVLFQKEHAVAYSRGLKKAGLFLQRESQKIVPVDTGALKNSAATRVAGQGLKTEVSVLYTQSYAIYVHENLNARHAPGKQAKFLEAPARQHRMKLLEIIKKEMKQ
jgi:hypothetical protein